MGIVKLVEPVTEADQHEHQRRALQAGLAEGEQRERN